MDICCAEIADGKARYRGADSRKLVPRLASGVLVRLYE